VEKRGMTSEELTDLTGKNYRTLMRWQDRGLFEPIPETKERAKKKGLEFDLRNVQKALTIVELRDRGVSLQKIRKAIDALNQFDEDLASAVLFTDGEGIYRVKERDELDYTDLVDSPGQLTTSEFFDLGEVAEKAREEFQKKVA
jgi:DNA-binding transcriptional MerR regulator